MLLCLLIFIPLIICLKSEMYRFSYCQNLLVMSRARTSVLPVINSAKVKQNTDTLSI